MANGGKFEHEDEQHEADAKERAAFELDERMADDEQAMREYRERVAPHRVPTENAPQYVRDPRAARVFVPEDVTMVYQERKGRLRRRYENLTQASQWPTDAAARKHFPVVTGVLDYFPDALLAVAECSRAGNEQHHPGEPLHWDRSKSTDEADALGRHLMQRGTLDTDGIRHTAKVAWRALALLQKEIENETTTKENQND